MAEATSVGQIGLDLVVNQGQFNKQLSGITKTAKKAGTALAAAFGVKQLVNFGKQCIDLGSDLQEVQNVVDSTFTSMSSKVDKFAKDSMKNYGLSETMAKKYTGTLGAMAKAFGFSENQAYDMSTTLTGLAGDIASFYNISQDEAFTKIKSVFTGETEALKELGVVMTQTALDQYALANGFGKTTSAMTEAEKVALRYSFVQNQLATATGDFARTSGGWANQVRVLTLQFESFKASIGQGLINALTPAIQVVNQLMGRLVALADAFSTFTGYFTKNKEAANSAKSIADSYAAAADASDAMASSGTKAADSVGKAAQRAAKKIRSLMGFDQINKVSDSEDTTSGSSSSSTSGSAGSGISTGIDTSTSGETEKLPKIYENLAKSIDRLKKSCSGLGDVLKSGLKWGYDNVLKPLGKWTISKLVPKVLDVFSGTIDVLTETLKALAPLGKWFWDNFLSKIAKFSGDAIIKFLGFLANGLTKLSDWISKHQTLVQNAAIIIGSFIASFKMVKTIVTFAAKLQKLGGVLGTIKTAFTKLTLKLSFFTTPVGAAVLVIGGLIAAGILLYKNWDKIKKKLKQFSAFFKKTWNNIKKQVGKAVDGILDTVEKIKELPSKIKEWFSEKIEGAEEWFSGIKEGFATALENLGDSIPDMEEINQAISEKIGEVKAKVSGKIEEAKDWWTSLKSGISEKIGEIKKTVSAVKDAAFDTVKAAWDAIKNSDAAKTIKAIKENAFDTVKSAWDAIKSGAVTKTVKAIKEEAFDKVKKTYNAIKDKTATVTAKLKNKAGKALTTLKDTWNSFKDKTATLTAKFQDVFTKPLKSVWNAIASKINGAIETINKVPGVDIKGRVPKLAQGGYVAKNTPQLAMIGDNRHQGEVVSPEKKLEEMALKAAQMASGSGNAEIISLLKQILAAILALNLTVNLDGKDITDNTIKRINAITNATGRSPIIT